MPRTPSPRALERRLRQLTREYDTLKTRIQEIGFIATGSLVERWTICGKPNCRCGADPKQRHGPYYQLSWKEDGVTVTRRLPPEHAQLYQQWLDNRRQLDELLREMHRVSAEAGLHLLRARTTEPIRPDHFPRPPRSRT